MKIKTAELKRLALDWAVAKALEIEIHRIDDRGRIWIKGPYCPVPWSPSERWEDGGRLIEQFKLGLHIRQTVTSGAWHTEAWASHSLEDDESPKQYGATPLIAAMRALVAAKLGDEVDVPEELINAAKN